MDAAGIETLLYGLGCTKIRRGSSWVSSTCPLAFARHAKGRDEHPSFAIRIDPSGESRCRCLACGYFGPLVPLLWKLDREDLLEVAIRGNCPTSVREDEPGENDLEGWIARIPYWPPAPSPERFVAMPAPTNEILDAKQLDEFRPLPLDVQQYLREKRGLASSTIELFELGYSRKAKRISIPIRDESGNLVGISGRAFRDQEPKYLHSRFKRDLVLYGEHLVEKGGTGYLVEGFFQAIAITDAGFPNAVARMGTHLSKWQRDKLVKYFSRLVIVADGDKPGRESAELIRLQMASALPTCVVDMPDGKDADSIPREQLLSILGAASSSPNALDDRAST